MLRLSVSVRPDTTLEAFGVFGEEKTVSNEELAPTYEGPATKLLRLAFTHR
jgi:hypothetical protein